MDVPIFNELGGVLLRPGRTTRVLCAKPRDGGGGNGGHCVWNADWLPERIGARLRELTDEQHASHTLFHNEIIVSGKTWAAHLPRAIEAFFRVRGAPEGEARRQHAYEAS